MRGAGCLGADTLLQLLKNYTRNLNIKTSITVGVIGLPNVGKSSLINSLKRARVAQVGNTPGVTRAVQEVHLDRNIKLLDSPGIVFSAADDAGAALRNCVKARPALPLHRCPAPFPSLPLARAPAPSPYPVPLNLSSKNLLLPKTLPLKLPNQNENLPPPQNTHNRWRSWRTPWRPSPRSCAACPPSS